MIIRAGDHEHFAEAEEGAGFFARGGKTRRVINGAGGDNGALPRHQPRNGAQGSDGAGIGQRYGGAFEIGELELVRASAGHDIVIGGHELRERHAIGIFHVGNF